MKIKTSKLKEVLKKKGLNEGFLTKLFSNLLSSNDPRTEKIKKLEKQYKDANDDLQDFVNSVEDEEMRQLYRKYIKSFKKVHDLP
jgi:hypothetical protein